jgi:hypothetical protein
MADNPYVFKNLVEEVDSKLLWQYKSSANLRGWLGASFVIRDILQGKTALWHDSFTLSDDIIGLGLDLVGQAIGLPRFVIEKSGIGFQWDITPWDLIPWGDDPTILYELIPDAYYRRAILSFGFSSNTISTEDAIIKSIGYILSIDDYSKIIVTAPVGPINAQVTVDIDSELNFIEEQLLRHRALNNGYLWAKTTGVRFTLNFTNTTITVS